MKRSSFMLVFFLMVVAFFAVQKSSAATLQNLSDTIGTSQPSTASSPITAMHTISFQPIIPIPVNGKIIITFPTLSGTDTNAASPSAQAFQFNGLSTSQIQVHFSSGSSTCSPSISNTAAGETPTITCTVASGLVDHGTTVTFLIGCTAASGITCTTEVPKLINPLKPASGSPSTVTAAIYKINVLTQDASGNNLDSVQASVGIIEAAQIQAHIDPTLTFQILGIGNGVTLSSHHGANCPSQSTNTGSASTSTFVNLGSVGTNISIAAQDLLVSTNAQGGYVLSTTATGPLNNPQNSYNIASSTTPGFMTAGTELFGIHPCGNGVDGSFVPSSPIGAGSGGKVAWPTAATALTLASHTGPANALVTTVMYDITAASKTPTGAYNTSITYLATPTF